MAGGGGECRRDAGAAIGGAEGVGFAVAGNKDLTAGEPGDAVTFVVDAPERGLCDS